MKRRPWNGLALVLWPLVAFALGWQAAPLGGTCWACAAGAFLGILLHWRSRDWPLRLPAVWAGAALGLGLVKLLQTALLTLEAPSQWLGSDRCYLLCQDLTWLGGWAVLLAALRWSSQRWRPFFILEGGLATLAVVWLFSGHRQGFINRPFFLVDPLWGQGIDPLPAFLGLGVLCALLVGLLAASHHRGGRPLWDLPLLVLLLVVAFLCLPPTKIKEWSEKYGLADGTGKEKRYSEKDGKGKKGSKDGKGSPTPSQGKGGNKQEPSFSDAQPPKQNPPVAVVIFRDDYTPQSGAYYFRQSVYSEYNGIKLVRSNDPAYDRDNPDGYPTHSQLELPLGETLGIRPFPREESAFQKLPTRVGLLTQHSHPFGLSNPVRFWSCENPDPKRFQKAYEVESMVLTLPYKRMIGREAGDPSWSREDWVHYTEGPKDPRYAELVKKIVAESTLAEARPRDPFFKAVSIKLWLDDNATYSLHSPHSDSADPVGDYLFGDRVGYCVFSSHAACYLFRAAGIPARIAEGYAVPAASRGSGSALLVRAREAHSWPEIYLQGLGWIDLDISPKKNLEPPGDPVDGGLQNMLGDMARKDQKHKTPDQPKHSLDLQLLIRQILAQMAGALPWSLLLTLAFLALVKAYRRLAPGIPWSSPERLALTTYRCVLDRLADMGQQREIGETREELARRLRGLSPSLLELTRLHLAARLGMREVSREDVKRAFQSVQSELDQSPQDWRHWLRRCNPISWWSVN